MFERVAPAGELIVPRGVLGQPTLLKLAEVFAGVEEVQDQHGLASQSRPHRFHEARFQTVAAVGLAQHDVSVGGPHRRAFGAQLPADL